MSDANDNELVREFAREKSEAAFAALVRQHVNLVFATSLRQVGDRSAAEEITQTVFVALAQSAGKLGSHPTIAGWLHQTALNKSREWLRGELRRRRREETAVSLAETRAEGDSVWASLVPLLDEALLQLRDADRAAVIMHFMEGRTFSEVGSVLGVGEDTARKRVDRCLEQLTKFFQRQGFTVPALSATTPLFALASHSAPTGLASSITSVGLAAHSASTLTVKGALKIMAWTKVKTAIVAGVGLLIVAGTGTVIIKDNFFPSEPSYHGKRLSEWLADIDRIQPSDPKRARAANAIRKMGTKTLPFLLADLGDKRYKRYARKQDGRTSAQRNSQATRAFDALGSIGKPAIPELVGILKQNPGYVPGALAGIGRDALPELLKALTNADFFVRDNTAAYLANTIYDGKINPAEAQAAFPIALKNLTYTSTNELFQWNTRWRAAGLLEALHLNPDESVPALLQCMEDSMSKSNYTVAARCALALSHFGNDAQSAIPAMVKSMKTLMDKPSDLALVACETQFAIALGNFGNDAKIAVPVLTQAENSTNAVLSQIAIQSLKIIQ